VWHPLMVRSCPHLECVHSGGVHLGIAGTAASGRCAPAKVCGSAYKVATFLQGTFGLSPALSRFCFEIISPSPTLVATKLSCCSVKPAP